MNKANIETVFMNVLSVVIIINVLYDQIYPGDDLIHMIMKNIDVSV